MEATKRTLKEAVEAQFSAAAAAYATSGVHAGGPDLEAMLVAAHPDGTQRLLDVGSGAGHTSIFFAPHVAEVHALDLSEPMLDQGRRLASERGLTNLEWHCGEAEALPFPDAHFDLVTSRQSAHHYEDLERALAEIVRVLRAGGRLVVVDSVAPEDHAGDTFLNTFEILRDASHVRDHRVSDWCRMLEAAGLHAEAGGRWWLDMDFEDWVRRSATPPDAVEALRAFVRRAPHDVRAPFFPDPEGCSRVKLEAGLVVGTRTT